MTLIRFHRVLSHDRPRIVVDLAINPVDVISVTIGHDSSITPPDLTPHAVEPNTKLTVRGMAEPLYVVGDFCETMEALTKGQPS